MRHVADRPSVPGLLEARPVPGRKPLGATDKRQRSDWPTATELRDAWVDSLVYAGLHPRRAAKRRRAVCRTYRIRAPVSVQSREHARRSMYAASTHWAGSCSQPARAVWWGAPGEGGNGHGRGWGASIRQVAAATPPGGGAVPGGAGRAGRTEPTRPRRPGAGRAAQPLSRDRSSADPGAGAGSDRAGEAARGPGPRWCGAARGARARTARGSEQLCRARARGRRGPAAAGPSSAADTDWSRWSGQNASGAPSRQDERLWLDRLDGEHDNLRTALRRLIERGAVDDAQALAGALTRFWFFRGHFSEGRAWLVEVLELPGAAAPTPGRAACHFGLDLLSLAQGDWAAAEV